MLKDILIQQIKRSGSMDLYTYMALCQTHPIYGYYTSKASASILGHSGDFITAPEISPLFGEMVALWVFAQWERIGKPEVLQLVELGPGQGTLMQDVLYTLKKLGAFTAKCRVHFVEINPSFRQLQTEKLQSVASVFHHDSIKFLEGINETAIVIANEFFDALPAQQYVNQEGTWYQVGVGIEGENELKIVHLSQVTAPDALEYQPDIERMLASICNHISRHKGGALIIDYGYWDGEGESLQAVYQHKKVGILEYPGQADLSVHVNFQKMALYCKKRGLHYMFKNQRQFLMDFGIQLRLELICRNKENEAESELRAGVQRLIDSAAMGQLFKVLEIWKN